MNQTLIIGKKDAEELLTMEACIRAMEETFRDISAGNTTMLQRSMIPQTKGNTFALMASDNQQQEICGVKHPMDERVLIAEVLEELGRK